MRRLERDRDATAEKLIGFSDSNMLQLFETERFLPDQMSLSVRKPLQIRETWKRAARPPALLGMA
jgi:hypothetical protein